MYDEIQLDNRSRVSDAVLRRGLSVLRPGDPVHIDNLESRLLRLSDLPGAAVQALRAGAHPGSSTLLVNAAPTPLVTGSIDADNFGGYYTGEYRLGGSLDVNSPLRLGDQLSLRLLTSDRKQRYYYAAYQAPVGPALTRLGLNVSNMRYALGRDFEILEAHGSARTTGIFLQQPLIAGRHFRLEARLQYEDRQLRDDIDLFSQRQAKRIRLGTASLSANGEDSLFGGGRSAAYISYSHGSLRLETEAQRIRDRALNRSAGGFGKLNSPCCACSTCTAPSRCTGRSAPSAPPRTSTAPNSSAWAAPTACAPTPTARAAATRAGRPRSNCATCPWPACSSRPSPTRAGSSSANAPGPTNATRGGFPPPA